MTERDYSQLPPLTDTETEQLKRDIRAARDRGDREEVARLQDLYRSRAVLDRPSFEESAGASTEPDAPAASPSEVLN